MFTSGLRMCTHILTYMCVYMHMCVLEYLVFSDEK